MLADFLYDVDGVDVGQPTDDVLQNEACVLDFLGGRHVIAAENTLGTLRLRDVACLLLGNVMLEFAVRVLLTLSEFDARFGDVIGHFRSDFVAQFVVGMVFDVLSQPRCISW